MKFDSYSSIIDYLKNVGTQVLDDLYSHPPTSLVVFRVLPDLSKQFLMRLLFIEQPITKSVVAGWVDKNSLNLYNDSCKALSDLRIWHSIDSNIARGSWILNKKFQESMKIALFGGGKPLLSDLGTSVVDKYFKSYEFLQSYSSERWDSILHFMVGSETTEVSSVVKDVLMLSNLMKRSEGSDNQNGITKHGFHFLLMSKSSQIDSGKNLVEALQFVFQLGFLSPTMTYPVDELTDVQQGVLQHMREIGLAYQRKRVAPRFHITPLALTLCGTESSFSTNSSSLLKGENYSSILPDLSPANAGYIILETNFRLYAYTDSPLKTALLSLFCKIRARFPNFVIADITRDSVREALTRGITADQKHILPPTIVDQIRLWELERDRFVFQEGCLYEQFTRSSDFEMVRDYAKSINVLLWENPDRRLMVVSKSGHEDIRKFWKKKRPS